MIKFRFIIFKIFSWFLHCVFFATILYLLIPIFTWYLNKLPIIGVDFYNSVTYVSYLKNHFSLPVNGFKDIWFAGYPLFRDFISLHFYPMLLLAKKYGEINGIQLYVLVTVYLLGIFSYLLYFHLAKSRFLALLLTFFVLYSVNIYGSAVWGGSLPYFCSQFFLPLVILLICQYIARKDKRYFYGAILFTGLGFIGHPLPIISFVIPAAAIFIFFGLERDNSNTKIRNIISKIKQIFIFGFVSLLVALPVTHEQVYFTIYSFFQNGPAAFFVFLKAPSTPMVNNSQPQASQAITQFYQGLPRFLYLDTNIWLLGMFVIGLLLFLTSLVFIRKREVFNRVLPIFLFALYTAANPILNAYGYSFLSQGWYRAFWPFPIAIASLTAAFWGEFFRGYKSKLEVFRLGKFINLSYLPTIIFSLIFIFAGYSFYINGIHKTIADLDTKSEYSSAHPQALSIRKTNGERDELKKELTPRFINPDDNNKRLYEADALVNIWWSSLFSMPLSRGYIDPPIATSQRAGIFWLDTAIANDTLTREFKISESTALNNALFLIDWNGIYYYEGGRLGISASAPPSTYLLDNQVFDEEEEVSINGAILRYQTASGKPELHQDIPQYLKFYKVKDEYASPILSGVNSPVIGVFSDLEGYEDLMRVLGGSNLNSRYIIPINAGPYVDEFSKEDFALFNGVFLHRYNYHNRGKAFKLLTDYLQNGGKVYIDTGGETKESNSANLPDFMPVSSTLRGGLGKDWDFEINQDSIIDNLDFSRFGPPVYNEEEWKFSYADTDKVRAGATVLLKNNNKPILVRQPYGKGQIIWTGLNLLYHINQYKSEEEVNLFLNILQEFIPFEKTDIVEGIANWIRPEKITFSSEKPVKGVLLKEQAYEGWQARITSGTRQNLPVFRTGPTYPGFIYVPVAKEEPFVLEFNYKGERQAYFTYGIFLLVLLLVARATFFKSALFGNTTNHVVKKVTKKIGSWWEKEEEGKV